MTDNKILTRDRFIDLCIKLTSEFSPVMDHEWALRELVLDLQRSLEHLLGPHPTEEGIRLAGERLARAKAVSDA